MLSRHPELKELTFHVRLPNAPDNVVIASNAVPLGTKAGKDDLDVMREGKIVQRPNRAGEGYRFELPLFNRDGVIVGALDVAFDSKAGSDNARSQEQARLIRNELSSRIADEAQLAAVLDAKAAQALAENADETAGSFVDIKEKSRLGTNSFNTPMTDENFSGAFQKATAAVTPEDSYKYTNNLSKSGTTGYDLTLRGFTTTASDRGAIITDGEPGATVRFGAPPNAAVDHVEVIKGPAAVLYGAGQPGGFVNVVTRKPDEVARNEISITGRLTPVPSAHDGDTSLNRGGGLGSIDVNAPLDDEKTLLGRIIAYGVDQNGWRDFSYDHQTFVKPMLLYRPDERTEIYASFENREAQSDDFIGLVAPKNNIKLINSRAETSYQNPGDHITEFGNAEVISIDHSFDGNAKFSFDARNVHHADYSSALENSRVQGDFTTLQRLYQRKQNDRDYSFFNSNLQLPFETWSITNRVVIGVSGGRDFLGTTRFQYLIGATTPPTLASLNISIYNPYSGSLNYGSFQNPAIYALCGTGPRGTITTNACNKNMIVQNTNQYTMGLRASDLIGLTDQWKVLLAERYDGDWDHFSQVAVQPIPGINPPSTYTQYYIHRFLPMASLIYEPVRNELSFYATYATGFVPAGGNNNDIHGHSLTDPSTARSEEFGVKSNFFQGRLNATGAVFNIQKEKTPVAVSCALDAPAGTGCFAPSTTHSRGVEFQADARLTTALHVIGGYTLTDARIYSSPDPTSDGARATNTPRHSAHLLSRYDFTDGPMQGLGFGLGESLIDWRAGTIPTAPAACSVNNGDACYNNVALKLPGYATTDLTVYYKMSPFDLTMKIGNLFDRGYIQSAGGGTNMKIITGDPRNFTITARMPF